MLSCVSHNPSYRGDWERQAPTDNAYYTVYLIGDAGYSKLDEPSLVFDHLKEALDKESSDSAVVWLGDNIYPVGLAPSASIYHAQGRHRLMAQLETMTDYSGHKFFVPGNHDWYTYGRIGLRRQEFLVDSFLLQTPNPNNQDNFFLPDKGCGDPMAQELIEGISLLTMDSHWYLNEQSRMGDQSVCGVQSPKEFIDQLQSEILRQDDNSVIVASHHPPYTYAHHGGKFPLKDDVFPLTQKIDWLYLPLPVVGYVFNRLRLRVSEQDAFHPLYVAYRKQLIEALQEKGRSIVASGHEHTLQFIENYDQYFIVSGAGSKNNKVALGKGSKFAIGEKGYVKLVFINPKRAIAQFIVPGKFEEYANVAYEKVLELN
jgi:hypothetical protein